MQHSFTLPDAHGKEHTYTLTLHPAAAGVPITLALMSKMVRPLLEGLEALATSSEALSALEGLDLDAEGGAAQLLGVLAGANLGNLGEALQAALAAPGLEPLIYAVLSETYRDGAQLIGPDGKPTAAFGTAYQGNYMELLSAAVRVVRLNRFVSLPGIS